jgi:two-component system response regulator ChvI
MTTTLRESVSVSPNSSPSPVPADRAVPAQRIRLVLVDDDEDFREAACAELDDLGFAVESFADGASMFDYLVAGNSAEVIVLDWRLRAGCGIDLLPQLRRRGIQIPVIFLTGISATAYETAALDRGALDFVDKARGIPILARRVRLIVESGKQPPEVPKEEVIQCGKLSLRAKVSRAYWNDVDVDLTVTEFNIVHLLAQNAGEYVTNRAIYDCVHRVGFVAGSGEDGYRTNVRSSVKRIRNKFRAIDGDFAEIENFPGFGYRWRNTANSTG